MSAVPVPCPPHARTQTRNMHNSVSYPVTNYAACFLFFRGRLKINHLQRVPLMRWEKTPLYNLKISFLSTQCKTDGKTMEWQQALSDVMMCAFFFTSYFTTPAEAALDNSLPVGASSQGHFWFWKTVDSPTFFPSLIVFCSQVLPYWGNPHDRKVIRKFWSQVSEDALLASTRSALQPAARVHSPRVRVCVHRKRSTPKTRRSTW